MIVEAKVAAISVGNNARAFINIHRIQAVITISKDTTRFLLDSGFSVDVDETYDSVLNRIANTIIK